MTAELWLRKSWVGPRDDAQAIAGCKDALAKAGYVIDRLKPLVVKDTSAYWHYTIPVSQVAN